MAITTAVCLAAMAAAPAWAGARAGAAAAGLVLPVPARGTPRLSPTSTTETVRQLVQCGHTMYAAGIFTRIGQGHSVYVRNNLFSFSATAPYTVTAWNPDVNGPVNSIALTPNCADAYIGGQFTSVHGTRAGNLAEIATSGPGTVVGGFAHDANSTVETLLAARGHLLAGGRFTAINGSRLGYYASLNPVTGNNDGFLDLRVSGHYQYPGVVPNPTEIYNQQLSHHGTLLLAEGDFTSVGGRPRQQIFMLRLTARHASVTAWTSPEFSQQCAKTHPFYIKAAAWSPGDSVVYVADTGRQPNNWSGSFPLTGLCDVVAAFPATQAPVTHSWINYTGCNSLYSVAASTSAVYAGGHEQWADDANGCKSAGHGAVPARGMGAFRPGTGKLLLNAARTAGRYTRARGHGADDMLLTSSGLWVASDDFEGSNTCGGVPGHAGICFLPYPGSAARRAPNQRPVAGPLAR
jgi:hypothetical protein